MDRTLIEAGQYMRGTTKMIRDAETSLLKMLAKLNKGGKAGKNQMQTFDPKKPKSVRIYVARSFPEWQDTCVGILKEVYDEESDKFNDAKVKELLIQKGLIKDKRAMPFIQGFKVRLVGFTSPVSNHCPLETHTTIWCRDGIPSHPAIL